MVFKKSSILSLWYYSLDQEKLDKAEIQLYFSTLLKSNKISMSKERRKQISEVLYIGKKEYD